MQCLKEENRVEEKTLKKNERCLRVESSVGRMRCFLRKETVSTLVGKVTTELRRHDGLDLKDKVTVLSSLCP